MHPTTPPRSLRELFWGFSVLAVQGFGGVAPVVQRELIERRRWFTHEQFLEDWAVAQVLPGPNITNLCILVGDRYLGARGALVALLGLFVFPLVLLGGLALALAFTHYHHLAQVQGALRGMGLVVVGLILATALKLLPALRRHVGGAVFCGVAVLATVLTIVWLRWPLVWVLLLVGTPCCVWTYHCLRARSAAGDAT